MSTRLLVSVRSAAEADAALAGGAGLIDVKEPLHGPLGRADRGVMQSVIRTVDGRCPVSAALGELREHSAEEMPPAGLSFVKWGLAGCAGTAWREEMMDRSHRLSNGETGVVVAYADAERAGAPRVDEVVEFACRMPWPGCVLLIDTYGKQGETLLTWLEVKSLGRLRQDCRNAGVRLALAGSLGPHEIQQLAPLAVDWIAVRGAACAGRDRRGSVSEESVGELVRLLVQGRFSASPLEERGAVP